MNKEIYKNKIITEIFNSGAVHAKVKDICFRHRIHKDTFIQEDIVSEVFYHLSKFNIDTLIEMYEDNPKRIIGLAVRIAIWKGVTKNKNWPHYHKFSVATNILFASNLNTLIQPVEDNEYTKQLIDKTQLPFEDEDEFWHTIKQELSDKENTVLETILTVKKGRGKHSHAYIAQRDELLNSIKSILTKRKINVQ